MSFKSVAVVTIMLLVTVSASRAEAPTSRRWSVEQERNGRWVKSATFDTRQDAQAKLEETRKRSTKNGAAARVVPTDWAKYEHMGSLSAKYESGGRASSTVSTGKGDAGGVSYGTYQLASKVGTAQRFVDAYYADWFHGTKPGSEEFSSLWKQLAAEREPELAVFEHLFIADTHYQPFADRLKAELGLDLDEHSAALRDVAWSVAVQHGAGNKIFSRGLEKARADGSLNKLSDAEIIELVYTERGRIDANGVSAYFSKNSPQVQKSVMNRFKNEKQDALKALAAAESEKPRRK